MMENVTKSIIYGNVYENRYGKFLPVCASILDRGISIKMKHPSNPFWIIFKRLHTSKSIIESRMLIESSKHRLSSLLKRKMWKTSIMMAAIVMKLLRVQVKSCCIYSKNSV